MKILVTSYSKTYWCLKPFAYLFNKYWGMSSVTVLHYPKIPFELPENFNLFSPCIRDYPKNKWADGVIKYLESVEETAIVLLLEDYWLTRKVNRDMINVLCSAIETHDNILRIDLTADRLYAGGMKDAGYLEWIDLVEAPGSQYEMSLQAGVWHRENLLKVLNNLDREKRSSWDVELEGTIIVNADPELKVYGTRQYPVRYENGVNVGAGVNYKLPTMITEDKEHIKQWLP